jgi:hypothetical protein
MNAFIGRLTLSRLLFLAEAADEAVEPWPEPGPGW